MPLRRSRSLRVFDIVPGSHPEYSQNSISKIHMKRSVIAVTVEMRDVTRQAHPLHAPLDGQLTGSVDLPSDARPERPPRGL